MNDALVTDNLMALMIPRVETYRPAPPEKEVETTEYGFSVLAVLALKNCNWKAGELLEETTATELP